MDTISIKFFFLNLVVAIWQHWSKYYARLLFLNFFFHYHMSPARNLFRHLFPNLPSLKFNTTDTLHICFCTLAFGGLQTIVISNIFLHPHPKEPKKAYAKWFCFLKKEKEEKEKPGLCKNHWYIKGDKYIYCFQSTITV